MKGAVGGRGGDLCTRNAAEKSWSDNNCLVLKFRLQSACGKQFVGTKSALISI